jgi:hypothetical protein
LARKSLLLLEKSGTLERSIVISERQGELPSPKRARRERTDEWAKIQQWTLWPEQTLYEEIRPLVLFHETAGERAKEIDVPQRTLARKADEFERLGMRSLFSSEEHGGARESSLTLPAEIRQLIVDLHYEMPTMSWREIAEICYIRHGRRPHHKHVKRIATAGSQPSLQARRYRPWHEISDSAERKLAVIRLHSEGWSVTSIASYLVTSRHTVYDTLQRWADEGVAGLDAKPKTNKGVRKATLKIKNEIRKLQENPLLGEYRVHTALLRMGIDPGAPWQNYAETLFGIQKRLSDFAFAKASTWSEIQQVHKTWWTNYNLEHHYGHRTRQDGRHSPSEVLRGVLGRTFPEEVLSRALYATQFTRQIDRHGFVKFKHWRLYGELGLAGEDVSVWVYEGNLKVEYQATALALYELSIEKDTGKIAKVTSARRLETHFRSAQLDLWQISDTEWLLALRRPEPAARKKAGKIVSLVEQLVLPEFGATG